MAWMKTQTGKKFDFTEYELGDFCIYDIAHALSQICRFGGHTDKFYSVAQHSCFVVQILKDNGIRYKHVLLAALLHDASEAYIGDITRPVKGFIGNVLLEIQDNIQTSIYIKFVTTAVDDCMLKVIDNADNLALATEKKVLLRNSKERWPDIPAPAKYAIKPLPPDEARVLFLEHFEKLIKADEISSG